MYACTKQLYVVCNVCKSNVLPFTKVSHVKSHTWLCSNHCDYVIMVTVFSPTFSWVVFTWATFAFCYCCIITLANITLTYNVYQNMYTDYCHYVSIFTFWGKLWNSRPRRWMFLPVLRQLPNTESLFCKIQIGSIDIFKVNCVII